MFGTALFYPTIDIHDEDWLKTAYLFWDGIRTIVPESMVGDTYRNNTTEFLSDIGYIKPIVVNSDSPILKSMVDTVKRYAQTDEGMAFLNQRAPEDVYINPYDDDRSQFYLHHEKLPFEIQQLVADKLGRDGWARVSDNFADFYMSLLANKISSQKSLALLAPANHLDQFTNRYRTDTYGRHFTSSGHKLDSLGRCMLTRLMIDGISIDPLTSMDDLRIFKERHQCELKNFRDGFDELVKMDIPEDITLEGLEQMARDIYQNKFLGAYQDLQNSLKGSGIRFVIAGAGGLMFSDVSTTFNELLKGLDAPVRMAIGAGATLGYSCYKTYKDNQKLKRKHKMSYLLSIERELGRRY